LALARLFEGRPGFHDLTFHKADQQALCSLIAFNIGAFVGRVGDRIGSAKRIWQISGTLLQALFTMAAALAIWKSGQPSIASNRGDPAWTNLLTFVGLTFMSMSLGLQGIQGKRLNTQFGTTSTSLWICPRYYIDITLGIVVLTTIWVELMSDPRLFKLRQKVASRDHKTVAAVSLFVGGFCSRALVGKIGAAGTLGVGVGFRIVIAFFWIFVPSKASPQS
jgi:Protein of unknown function (DUF1275)